MSVEDIYIEKIEKIDSRSCGSESTPAIKEN